MCTMEVNMRGVIMQCDDCKQVYQAENEKQPCPKCGGKGTILVDITMQSFPNRAERRKAGYYHGKKLEKYLPCDCQKK